NVQAVSDPPDEGLREGGAARGDLVQVVTRTRVVSRVEARPGRRDAQDVYVVRQQSIYPRLNLPRRRLPLFPLFTIRLRLRPPIQPQMRDLMERVHARVRAPGAADLDLRAEELRRGLRQFALHRARVRLPLPPAVARPLVLDLKLPDSHPLTSSIFGVMYILTSDAEALAHERGLRDGA